MLEVVFYGREPERIRFKDYEGGASTGVVMIWIGMIISDKNVIGEGDSEVGSEVICAITIG